MFTFAFEPALNVATYKRILVMRIRFYFKCHAFFHILYLKYNINSENV